VGITLGPTAVVLFNTSRTLTRFVWQILNTISNTVWVELSKAFGEGDLNLARQLHRKSCRAALWLAILASVGLFFCGKFMFHIWTKGAVALDPTLFAILLLVVICNSLWSTSYIVMLSVNQHQRLGVVYLLATGLSLLFAAVLTKLMGINGAAVALLLIDCFMILYVVVRALALLGDNVSDYVKFLVTPPRWTPRLS
jgi:O-antigen/teichoic acid export membrane protein